MNKNTILSLFDDYHDNYEALDLIRLIKYTNSSVLLMGKAGTGKSTLLLRLINHLNKNYVILAPTGIAALNVNGQTIHSFFQFELRPYLNNDYNLPIFSTEKQEIMQNIDLIIIDEISMVKCDIMNAIDLTMKKYLGNNLPFGGKQLLMVGDLFQLSPVVKNSELAILRDNYTSRYFFNSKVFEDLFEYKIIELQKVYRQEDNDFIEILNGIRENTITDETLAILNQRCINRNIYDNDTFTIFLATTNLIVKSLNERKLNNLPGNIFTFRAETTGICSNKNFNDNLPTDRILNLKIGSQIMFVKNDILKRWVNGTIGEIIKIGSDSITVRIKGNEQNYEVERVRWEYYNYTWDINENKIVQELIGSYAQFPIKLAWAVTIHKSQGQTFNNIIIDMGNGAFSKGQTYVALSRCTTLNGISLINPIVRNDILVDQRIINFINQNRSKTMERERFEVIVTGLQEKNNQLETENNYLKNKNKELGILISDQKKTINKMEVRIKKLDKQIRLAKRTIVILIILILILFLT